MTMTGGGFGGDWTEVDDLDAWTADRLLDGDLDVTQIPDGYERVAKLIGIVKEGVEPASSGWGSPTVPAMARIVTSPTRLAPLRSRPRARAWRIPNAAAVVVVLGALSAGTAAAATDSLPAPVQSAIHSAGNAFGVPIPAADPNVPSAGHSSGFGSSSGPSRSVGSANWSGSSGAGVGPGSGSRGPAPGGTTGTGEAPPTSGGVGSPTGPSATFANGSASGDMTTPAIDASPDPQPPATEPSNPPQDVIPPAVTPTTQPPTTTSTLPSAAHGHGQGSGGGQSAGSAAHGSR